MTLEHRTPNRTYRLATIVVNDERAEPVLASHFEELRTNADIIAERTRMPGYLAADPDKTLAFVAEMDTGDPELPRGTSVAYVCPMHPDVISDDPGKCPHCGMKLMATQREPMAFVCPMHPEVKSAQANRCPKCGMKLVPAQLVAAASPGHQDHAHGSVNDRKGHDEHPHSPTGIEWEDDMLDVNRMTNPTNMRWKLIDRQTRAEGADGAG